ncbi:hypothetical protein VTN77DRAFT_6573 [Rasamsonia byssochlamydoides]|uniref:uncharacterized protein n=1 Tax=Rasamsonia byssochlamydoides TaxID=89139 RepID=UPI0037423E93
MPFTMHYHAITLSAVETALYHELKLYFESCNARVRPSKQARFSNDQSARINEVFENSDTFEEALIKRCTYFNAMPSWCETSEPLDTLVKVIQRRKRDIAALVTTIKRDLKQAVWLFVALGQSDEHFAKLEQSVTKHDFGDAEVTKQASRLVKDALQAYRKNDWTEFWSKGKSEKSASQKKASHEDSESEGKSQSDEESEHPKKKTKLSCKDAGGTGKKETQLPPFPEDKKEREKILREAATTLRSNISEWVTQARALRFMETVHRFQLGVNIPSCGRCGRQHASFGAYNLLGKCGHVVCKECVDALVKSEECPVHQCRGAVSSAYILNGRYFGRHQSQAPVSSFGGTKLQELVRLLQDTTRIPEEDRVILFVQYEEFMDAATAALEASEIPHVAIGARDRGVRHKVKAFTNDNKSEGGDPKVLILMLGSENSAGM